MNQPDPRTAQTRATSLLIVEDDPLVLMHTAQVLESAGHRVIAAADAAAAVATLSAGAPVDALFTDVNLPGTMDGIALARWVRRERPDALIVLTSGGMSPTDPQAAQVADAPLVPKPYDPEDVARRLGVLLARRRAVA